MKAYEAIKVNRQRTQIYTAPQNRYFKIQSWVLLKLSFDTHKFPHSIMENVFSFRKCRNYFQYKKKKKTTKLSVDPNSFLLLQFTSKKNFLEPEFKIQHSPQRHGNIPPTSVKNPYFINF